LGWVNSRRFIVLNGDSYCLFDLARLEEVHAAREARATIWLVPVDDCARYGTAEIDSQGMVRSFREKTGLKSPGLINGGVYLFDHDTIRSIPVGQPYSLERDLFPRLVRQGLYGVVGTAGFIDIGTPESYAMADQFFRGVSDTLPR
jgi:mannose-1-phosphate guanylyltransferase